MSICCGRLLPDCPEFWPHSGWNSTMLCVEFILQIHTVGFHFQRLQNKRQKAQAITSRPKQAQGSFHKVNNARPRCGIKKSRQGWGSTFAALRRNFCLETNITVPFNTIKASSHSTPRTCVKYMKYFTIQKIVLNLGACNTTCYLRTNSFWFDLQSGEYYVHLK